MASEQMQRRLLELETELSSSKDLIYQISEDNERYREQAEALQNERNHEKATKLEETESERRLIFHYNSHWKLKGFLLRNFSFVF